MASVTAPRPRWPAILLLILLASCTAPASAATLHVAPSGAAAASCATAAAPCTLARALGLAAAADVVSLAAGGYDKDSCGLSVTAPDISLEGPSFSGGADAGPAAAATIDCEGTHRFLEVRGGGATAPVGISISHLIVTNTHYNGTVHVSVGGVRGGAFNFVDAGSAAAPIVLRNVHVRDAQVTGGGWSTTGACLNVQNSHVDVAQSSFTDCVNTDGRLSGAIYIQVRRRRRRRRPSGGRPRRTRADAHPFVVSAHRRAAPRRGSSR